MAQVDYFLKLDGVDGESQDAKHKGEIELDSFSWGEVNSGSATQGGGGGMGKVSPQDFHIVKRIDKSSPKLFIACAAGDHFTKGVLIARKAGGEQQEYLKLTFENLMVSSYQIGGSEVLPVEQVSLNFAKLEVSYKPQKADGTLDAEVKQKYDFAGNKKE